MINLRQEKHYRNPKMEIQPDKNSQASETHYQLEKNPDSPDGRTAVKDLLAQPDFYSPLACGRVDIFIPEFVRDMHCCKGLLASMRSIVGYNGPPLSLVLAV